MTIIGFNFSSISAKKHKPAKGQIKINRKCTPTNVEEISMGSGQKALKYDFTFSVSYDPEVAEIEFEGNIAEIIPQEQHKEIIELFEKEKKFPPKAFERVLNQLLDRCHVQALIMAKELGIPAPFKLPGVKVEEKKQQEQKEK